MMKKNFILIWKVSNEIRAGADLLISRKWLWRLVSAAAIFLIMPKTISMIGKSFGRLTVVANGPKSSDGRLQYVCNCECGGSAIVRGKKLRSGHTKSCGCINRELFYVHGESDTKEWRAWWAMIKRCTDPTLKAYKNYGGRGIYVCQKWIDSYDDFLADVGRSPSPELSLDRINNDGHYEPGNVRWATRSQQANNKRTSIKNKSA